MNRICYFIYFFIIIFLIPQPTWSASPLSEDYVSTATRSLQAMTQAYKLSPTVEDRKKQNDFIRTGNDGRRFKSLNYNRIATSAEKLIMMEAIISTTLVPAGPYEDTLKDYENFLSVLIGNKTQTHYQKDYKHNFKAYSIAKLAASEASGTMSFEDFINQFKIDVASKGIIDPSLIPDFDSYFVTLYQNEIFQNAFARSVGRKPKPLDHNYAPALLSFKEEEKNNRYRRMWYPLLSSSVFDVSLFQNLAFGGAASTYGPLVRRNLKTEDVHGASSPIYYDLIATKDVLEGRTPAKGVIINVYGGDEVEVRRLYGIPCTFESIHEEEIFAREGYIYYRLYPRGTKARGIGAGESLGGTADYRQDGTEGIFTLVRDVAYFAAKLKYRDAQILGEYRDPTLPLGGDRQPSIDGSVRIMGKRIPIILSGASFGGALTLMTACSNEKIAFTENDGTQNIQSLGEMFDGYIPKAPYVDIEEDVEVSPTKSAELRRWADMQAQKWFASAYPQATFTGRRIDTSSLTSYSIYDKLVNIKRPILVVHGLNDNNTLPQSSANLVLRAGSKAEKYISVLFEGEVGHFVDAHNSSEEDQGPFKRRKREYIKYLERVFKFIDLIRWHKERYSVFTLSQPDIQATKDLAVMAPLLMAVYNTNPEIHSPFERFAMSIIKQIATKGDNDPSVTETILSEILRGIRENDTTSARSGLSTLLIAALLDLKSRDLFNGFNDIENPIYTIKQYWHYSRQSWLKEVYEGIFGLPASSASEATRVAHVLERYSAWSQTCIKDPDAPGCQIDPRPYLSCLKDRSDPMCTGAIAVFCEKMQEAALRPKLDVSEPTKTLEEILRIRLMDPAFESYRNIIQNGDDIFSTSILNGRLG